MADKTIPELADGQATQPADQIPAYREGAVVRLTVAAIMAAIYPVGSIYANASDGTNPATLFGFGTWESLGAGRVPVTINTGDAAFDEVGKTGGTKTATPTGNVSAPTFTGTANQVTTSVSAGTPAGAVSQPTLTMDPYTPAGTLNAPVFTGSAITSGSASAGTPAGTNSAPVFTGTPLTAHAHELPLQIVSNVLHRILPSATFGTGTSRPALSRAAADTANATNAAVALSQNVSAGTPAGTINSPVFTGSAMGNHNHPVTAAGNVSVPVLTGTACNLTGTVSQPTFNGNALATHNHVLTAAGTVSAPAFTGDAHSILPPYVTCHIWKRTA